MINIVMGRPGIGKSTYLAIIAKKAMEKGVKVWSNKHIAGCQYFSVADDIMVNDISNGIVIIDESGVEFNSRNWKKFSDNLYLFFSNHRHYKLDIYMGVQMWSRLDLSIREVIQRIYIIKPNILQRWFIMVKTVVIDIDISEEQKIDEMFSFLPFVFGTKFYYRRGVYNMFDSYERLPLKEKVFPLWETNNCIKDMSIYQKIKIGVKMYVSTYFQKAYKKGNQKPIDTEKAFERDS